MPIVIQQPDMVSPTISEGYGRAEQFSRDLPSLVHQQTAIAAANQSYGHQVAQAQLQSGALAAHAGLQNAAIAGHARESALNRDFQMGQNEWQHNADMAKAEQHAELATWVNQQDMTQADNMRLQRLNQGVSRVQEQMASGQLTADEGADLITQLRTGIDPLVQRSERMRQKQMKAQTDEMTTKASLEATHLATYKDFAAGKLPTTHFTEEGLARYGRMFDDANPNLMAAAQQAEAMGMPGAVQAAQQARDKAIKAHAAEDPSTILGHTVMTDKGLVFKEAKPEKDVVDAATKHYDTQHAAWLKHQQAYDSAFQKVRGEIEKRNRLEAEGDPAKNIPARPGIRLATDEELDSTAARQVQIKKPGEEPVPPDPATTKGRPAGNPFLPKPAPAPVATAPTGSLKEQVQQQSTEVLKRAEVQLDTAPIPPEQKARAGAIIKEANDLIASVRGYNNLKPPEKKRYDELVQEADRLGKFAESAPQQSQAGAAGQMFGAAMPGLRAPASIPYEATRTRRNLP